MTEHNRNIDPFFEVVHDGEWNACVGVQGSEINYVEGYLDGARMLADAVIDGKMLGKRDTLVMPVLFNARHGFELALKYVIAELVSLELVRQPEGRPNHHILRYWEHLEKADVADCRVREIVLQLEPFAKSLSRMDVDGQQLRYFISTDNKHSFGDQAVVHLPLIRHSVVALAQLLGALTKRVEVLSIEHPTGTRTTRCSRTDLADIVDIVGPNATWTENAFLDRKAVAMARHGLTKKAFSNAIDAVRASRELSARIGIERDLTHIGDDRLIHLVECWLEAQPPAPEDAEAVIIRGSDLDIEDVQRYSGRMHRLVTLVGAALTPEEFADVETVYYIGRNRDFGEYYEAKLASTIATNALARRRFTRIYDIMSKNNLIEGLVGGLRRVGRPSLAVRVHDLQKAARPSPRPDVA